MSSLLKNMRIRLRPTVGIPSVPHATSPLHKSFLDLYIIEEFWAKIILVGLSWLCLQEVVPGLVNFRRYFIIFSCNLSYALFYVILRFHDLLLTTLQLGSYPRSCLNKCQDLFFHSNINFSTFFTPLGRKGIGINLKLQTDTSILSKCIDLIM